MKMLNGLKFFLILAAASYLLLAAGTETGWAYYHTTSKVLIKWREYTPQAFEESKKTGKPVFMFITAIWCFNCHIYVENTLETKEVSEYLNKHFIPVFVDYDKRKDIARQYPATGIPVTNIITPQGERLVSVAGYIPKEKLLKNLELTLKYIKEEYKPAVQSVREEGRLERIILPDKDGLQRYLTGFENMAVLGYDGVFGGFGLGAKQVFGEELLLITELSTKEKDKKWHEMLINTINHMAGWSQKVSERRRPSFEDLLRLSKRQKEDGAFEEIDNLQIENRIAGIYDHVEGGFFRYATRRDWTVPHYEKMLFENAQLITIFLKAYEITKDARYKEAAVRSIEYCLKNLYIEGKRFSGSQDADEVYYHLTLDERKKIKPPKIDRDSYTISNSRMIIALFYAFRVLEDERYKKTAMDILSFFEKEMITKNGVLSYYDDKKKKGILDGSLEHNAWFALALLEAYETTKDKRFLELAEGSVIGFAIKNLYDSKGGGFYERRSTNIEFYREGELFSDEKPYEDNAVMAYTLLKAYNLTEKGDYLKKAEETTGLFLAKFMTGETDKISPYLYRVVDALVKTGRYK